MEALILQHVTQLLDKKTRKYMRHMAQLQTRKAIVEGTRQAKMTLTTTLNGSGHSINVVAHLTEDGDLYIYYSKNLNKLKVFRRKNVEKIWLTTDGIRGMYKDHWCFSLALNNSGSGGQLIFTMLRKMSSLSDEN